MAQKDIYEMTDSSQFDIEQGADSVEASLLRSKFDTITSPVRSKFQLNRRKKKYAIVLGIVLCLWLVGTGLFMSGNADGILDYYKSTVNSYGYSETKGESEQYDDDDEQRIDTAVATTTSPDAYDDDDEPKVAETAETAESEIAESEEKTTAADAETVEEAPAEAAATEDTSEKATGEESTVSTEVIDKVTMVDTMEEGMDDSKDNIGTAAVADVADVQG